MLSCTISGGKTRKTYTPRWSTDSLEKPRRIDEEEEKEDAEFEEEQFKKSNHSQDHHQQQQQEEEGETGIDKTMSTPMEWWLEDICMLDMDYFVRTIAAIRSKGVRPQLVGTIISHYAIKWLPGLIHQQNRFSTSMLLQNQSISKANEDADGSSSEGMMTAHKKNRIVLETLIRILPAEKDALSCSFLLRLLRMATIVGTCDVYRADLERRIGMDLESATLPDLLIPSFSHTQHTIFDVQLVRRILGYFINRFRSNSSSSCGIRVPNSMIQVAKLLDGYLAEIALDANLDVASFESLAACMPSHARVCDDGLYRAIDTYLKAHPGITEDERKRLCKLMDCYKLSFDACMHASQNERLPVRTVLQVLFCEHAKLRNSCFCRKNPDDNNEEDDETQERPRQNRSSLDLPTLQQQVRKLSEDMANVQLLCESIQRHMEKTCRQHQHQRKNGGANNGGGGGGGGFSWMSLHGLRKIARRSAQLGRVATTFQRDRQKESDCLSQLEEESHRRHQQQVVMGNQQHHHDSSPSPPPAAAAHQAAAAESMPLDEGPWRRFSAS